MWDKRHKASASESAVSKRETRRRDGWKGCKAIWTMDGLSEDRRRE